MATKTIYLTNDPDQYETLSAELDTLFSEGYEVRIDNSKLIALYKADGVASEDKGMLFSSVAEWQKAQSVRSSTAGADMSEFYAAADSFPTVQSANLSLARVRDHLGLPDVRDAKGNVKPYEQLDEATQAYINASDDNAHKFGL